MKRATLAAIVLASPLVLVGPLYSHCEIPCGIYDDEARIAQIAEHIGTIEKSMKQITALSQAKPGNANQLVRWVVNKEKHADEIQHIVAQYFMTQRVKKYVTKLTLLHRMLVGAMKCKQTTDRTHVAELRKLLAEFKAAYFAK